ncbi:unnamed protein product [Brassica napus]|uniref:(rape) hypothetical protein n=1 Tax=Brassica napus TaxID=3708 RepID=A0A816L0E3_BRANA|nr:unnamed protein product [Brassica napus]
MLKAFKEEILKSVRIANRKLCVATEPTTPPPVTTSKGLTPANPPVGGLDANDATILNVLENISHYSTPPGSADRVTGSPSFSLGLTQDQPSPVPVVDDEMGDNGDGDKAETVAEPMPRRTSKRLRLVPPPLISDYQCPTAILNRARESKMLGSNYYELPVIREKFAKLAIILKKSYVINVAGLSVTAKDITDIAERIRPLPAKVFDILMRLVRSICYNHVGCSGATKPEFLDSRFVSMLCKNYERLKKSKAKDSYVFPKGLVDCAVKCCSSGNASTRFYMPLHVAKKHWIGLCVDSTDAKIYVLDCNPSVCGDSELTRELLPISDMFPYLLKFSGLLEVPGNSPLGQERVKGLAQNNNSTDAALTAALLIQAHALFGVEICRCITPEVITDEAQRAAVMIYEFHEKL